MYQMGLMLVGLVLYGRIGLLNHRLGKSSHAENVKVAYVLYAGTCERLFRYIQALRY